MFNIMNDLVLETTRTIVLFILIVYLWRAGSERVELSHKGWNLILTGFTLLFFGSAIDITDNYESLNHFVVIGDTEVQAFLEKMIGYLGGFILLAIGMIQWLPTVTGVEEKDQLIRDLAEINEERNDMNRQLEEEISERKQVLEKLKQSEGRFRSLFENMNSGVAVYTAIDDGKEFIFRDFNKAGEQIENISREEVVGKKATEMFPSIRDVGLLDVFQRVWKTGEAEHHPVSFYKDEMIAGWRENYVCKLPSGEIVAIYDDITERKQAEAALQKSEERVNLAIEGSGIGLWDWRVQTGETTFNERWAEIVGYTLDELEPVSVKTWEQLTHPDDLKQFDKLINDHFEGRTDAYECEVRMRHKDGCWVWVLDRGKVVEWDPEGNPSRMSGTHLDITERKQVEETMIRAKLTAEDASRTKSEFLANMSHELRTPLNSIIGFSDVLIDKIFGELNEKQTRYASNISNSGKHLLTLINDILDLSKIEAGKMELYCEEFLVSPAIKEVTTTIEPLASKKNIDLDVKIDPQLKSINADRTKFKQILYNLASNAIKFTPDNGSVTIESMLIDALIHISVTDTGIGISKEDQAKLFQPFKQLDSSLSREYQGTGLGLALVKKIVEMHGGNVQVESQIGEGSRFTFTIPID